MNDKYAVVTGSTKGIGKAIAENLLKNGYRVFINYSKDEESKNIFLEENYKYHEQIIVIKQNLDTYENAMNFCEKILSITQKIDVLILNCGTTEKTPFGSIKKESWEYIMNLNLNVPFYIIQCLSNHIKNDSGRIILISSVMGKYPHSSSLVYNVSKAGVNMLAKSLVKYFADKKITVNSICPGFINTPYHKGRNAESFERINKKIALHRFGDSKEVTSLCMEIINNQYINGANIDINGGYDYY